MGVLWKTRSISGVMGFWWTAAVAFVLLVYSLELALGFTAHVTTDDELEVLCLRANDGTSTTHAFVNFDMLNELLYMLKNASVLKSKKANFLSYCKAEQLSKLVGWPDNEFESPFHRFTESFHTLGIPAVNYWTETVKLYQELRPPLVYIRIWQKNFDHLEAWYDKCIKVHAAAYNFNNQPDPDEILLYKCVQDHAYKVADCVNDEIFLDVQPSNGTVFRDNFYKACYLQFDLIMKAFIYSAQPLTYNGRKPSWDYSPFGIMFKDTIEYDIGVWERVEKTFPDYIAQLNMDGKTTEAAELETKLKDIKARLKNTSLPYHKIYYEGDVKRMTSDRIDGASFKGKGVAPFLMEVLSLYTDPSKSKDKKKSLKDHVHEWMKDIKIFENDLVNKKARISTAFARKIIKLYTDYVQVSDLTTGSGSSFGGVLENDGKYKWDYENNGIHNMRLAWDLMGAVLEELKCYMKETYYFDLRQKALADTQQDLKKATLYSDISTTMLYPCRMDYNNEGDLVTGHCTKENHEICSPMAPYHQQQRPESRYHGGLALLRPRWVYKYSEKEKKCVGRRDYVMLMSVCRCGFRVDCGDDLGVNITCHLRNNDALRGQCRGTVGYPCMTLPLAPRMHNESCISGYCNAYQNSCEDVPATPYGTSRGAPVWNVDRETSARIYIVLAMALIAVKFQQLVTSL